MGYFAKAHSPPNLPLEGGGVSWVFHAIQVLQPLDSGFRRNDDLHTGTRICATGSTLPNIRGFELIQSHTDTGLFFRRKRAVAILLFQNVTTCRQAV